MNSPATYRFRPRYRGVAFIAAAIGAIFVGISLIGVGIALTATLDQPRLKLFVEGFQLFP